jgi:hypothetical protein
MQESFSREYRERLKSGGRVVSERAHTMGTHDTEEYELAVRTSAELESEFPESAHEIHAFIGEIQAAHVVDIFSEYLKKSGVDLGVMNTPSTILFDDNQHAIMSYEPAHNVIFINLRYFDTRFKSAEGDIILRRSIIRPEFVQTFLHEFTHVVGAVRVDKKKVETNDAIHERELYRMGVDSRSISSVFDKKAGSYASLDVFKVFELLNEGITEYVSYEVLLEYTRRSGKELFDMSTSNPNEAYVTQKTLSNRNNYDAARHFMLALVGAIAKDTGVSEDLVWRGFVRQYYSGELSAIEFVELLNDMFGEAFVDTLATAQDGTTLRELALSNARISAEYPGAAQKWLDRMHVTRGAH